MSGFDPTNRELCADGACIGVIGSDGKCRECGAVARSATTHSRLRGMRLPERDNDSDSEADEDPNRALCADDMCVGIIGPDGRCKECGLSAIGATPDDNDDNDDDDDDDDWEDEDGDDEDEDGEDDDRQLCPDDMCIGLIGSNGRCKECGTAASSGS